MLRSFFVNQITFWRFSVITILPLLGRAWVYRNETIYVKTATAMIPRLPPAGARYTIILYRGRYLVYFTFILIKGSSQAYAMSFHLQVAVIAFNSAGFVYETTSAISYHIMSQRCFIISVAVDTMWKTVKRRSRYP